MDYVNQLILAEAGVLPERVCVIDDPHHELTLELAHRGHIVAAFNDDLREALACPAEFRVDSLCDPRMTSCDNVLLRLPKALSHLDDYCQTLTSCSPRTRRVVAGGRIKHMSLSQNDVLKYWFSDVHASLGYNKARVLHAHGPLQSKVRWPKRKYIAELDLVAVAGGAVFNTNRLDFGTRLLITTLTQTGGYEGRRALDLGCGSGIIATWLAKQGCAVEASDVSAAAVNATKLTAQANNVDVTAVRRVGLDGVAPGRFDLIATNPPFHRGTTKDSTPTFDMIAAAGEILTPGAEFWCVFNSHLPYLNALRRHVGPTRVMAQDRNYLVTLSTKTAR